MGGIDRRIRDLEAQLTPPEDEGADTRRAVMRDILDELARLKASRAVGYRAGVHAELEDIPGKILGPGYTTEQLCELAVRRVFERDAPDILSEEAVEEMVRTWTACFRNMTESLGHDWHKVEDPAG